MNVRLSGVFSAFLVGMAALSASMPANARAESTAIAATVVQIKAADLLLVRLETGLVGEISVKNIDAPDRTMPQGVAAARITEKFLKSGVVALTCDPKQPSLCDVENDSGSLAEALLKVGLAWYDPKPTENQRLADLEASAQEYHVGIFLDPRAQRPSKLNEIKRNHEARVRESRG